MVEHLNRQRVLNFLDAFYSGDIEGALACCSDDIDFVANAPIDYPAASRPSPRQGRGPGDVAHRP